MNKCKTIGDVLNSQIVTSAFLKTLDDHANLEKDSSPAEQICIIANDIELRKRFISSLLSQHQATDTSQLSNTHIYHWVEAILYALRLSYRSKSSSIPLEQELNNIPASFQKDASNMIESVRNLMTLGITKEYPYIVEIYNLFNDRFAIVKKVWVYKSAYNIQAKVSARWQQVQDNIKGLSEQKWLDIHSMRDLWEKVHETSLSIEDTSEYHDGMPIIDNLDNVRNEIDAIDKKLVIEISVFLWYKNWLNKKERYEMLWNILDKF